MKKTISFVVLLIVLALAVCLYNKAVHFVSTDCILFNMRQQTHEVNDHVDFRYKALDAKLDRIEGKIDRLLKIAERPLPDGMQEAQ